MQQNKSWALALLVSLCAFTWSCSGSGGPPLLGKETVKGWLADPQVLVLDVRAAKDWRVSDKKIKGARRQDPDEVTHWAANLPKDRKIVLY